MTLHSEPLEAYYTGRTCLQFHKMLYKAKISFFGRTFSADRMRPDLAMIQEILDLPVPEDTTQLWTFLRMVNFMQQFVPYISHHTTPLRAILQKNIIFDWAPYINAAFQKLKSLLVKATEKSLKYFDRNPPITVQADASTEGLEAELLQHRQLITFV